VTANSAPPIETGPTDAHREDPFRADVFVQLPQIVDLFESLEDELTLSPERLQGS
jgi:hypothetical protein